MIAAQKNYQKDKNNKTIQNEIARIIIFRWQERLH